MCWLLKTTSLKSLMATHPDFGVASGALDVHLNFVGSGQTVPPSAPDPELPLDPEVLAPELRPVELDVPLDAALPLDDAPEEAVLLLDDAVSPLEDAVPPDDAVPPLEDAVLPLEPAPVDPEPLDPAVAEAPLDASPPLDPDVALPPPEAVPVPSSAGKPPPEEELQAARVAIRTERARLDRVRMALPERQWQRRDPIR
jgi:hypothetical protein